MQQLNINPELQILIPALTAEEYSQLTANILAEGIREPIITWNGTIVDGHNRYQIAQEYGLEFNISEMYFKSLDDCKEFMILNQFGRRNLPNYERARLALQLERIYAAKAKERQRCGYGGNLLPQNSAEANPIETRIELAKIANVSHDTVAKVKVIEANASEEVKEQLRSGEVSIYQAYKDIKKEEKKAERIQLIEKQKKEIAENKLPQLKGLYDIISVDPPWNYRREYDPETSRVANPYPEMTVDEIKAIKMPFSKDAILFLWTTHKFLPDAFEIANYWGFEYKATLVWNKEKIGMGAWFRMQCEFCIFAIKGNPFWNNTTERDIIIESRRQHSRKPDAFFNMVDKICVGRKLEYFSREKRDGWEIFGNDINKF